MKKIKFSSKNVKKNIYSIYNYVKNNYKLVLCNSPVLICFVITSLINTWLLRALTVHNYF